MEITRNKNKELKSAESLKSLKKSSKAVEQWSGDRTEGLLMKQRKGRLQEVSIMTLMKDYNI